LHRRRNGSAQGLDIINVRCGLAGDFRVCRESSCRRLRDLALARCYFRFNRLDIEVSIEGLSVGGAFERLPQA
jgi:hypothetical protein